jgi:hypothetical protein
MDALSHLAISPRGFCFDARSGATFSLNPSACRLVEGLRDGLGLGDLTALVSAEFDVREDQDPCRDVLDFIRALRAEGLLPVDFELGA